MRSLWLLTIKNLRLLLRSKASALVIIFAPLLIILLLGLSYNNTEKFGLNIGIVSPSFTDDVESFISVLEEEEFTIVRYEGSLDNCLEDIKSSVVHTCIELPESLQVEDNTQKEITFYIDPSRINLVWMVQETVKSKFNLKAKEISQNLAQDVLGQLDNAKNVLTEKGTVLDSVHSKMSSASTEITSANDNLALLDFTLENSSYDAEALMENSENIEDAENLIDDVLGSLNGAVEDETKREELRNSLKTAEDKLNLLLDALSTNGTKEGGLYSLVTELEDIKFKLDSASSTIDGAESGLASASNTLQESVKSLDSAKAALNDVKMNLAGQKVTDADTISTPLVTKIEKVSPEGTYLNYLFPALLVMVVMFSSLLLGTTLVMIEKNSPAFLRNFFLPIRKITFVTSIYITNLILILVEIAVILGISLFFLKDSLSVFPAVALVLFLAATVFTFIGMTIGYLFTSEETGVLASISLGSIFLFVSGVIMPLEGISSSLRKIISFNPFVIAEKLVREIFIFGSSLSSMQINFGLLIAYAVIFFVIILIIESFLHQHIVNRFLRHHHKAHRQREKKEKKDI